MKRSIRLLLAGSLLAGAFASAAPAANAMQCAEGFEVICFVIGLPCAVADNPKYHDLLCPGLG
jgi:hypothetical protein